MVVELLNNSAVQRIIKSTSGNIEQLRRTLFLFCSLPCQPSSDPTAPEGNSSWRRITFHLYQNLSSVARYRSLSSIGGYWNFIGGSSETLKKQMFIFRETCQQFGSFLLCEQTLKRCVSLLTENKFFTGFQFVFLHNSMRLVNLCLYVVM